MKARDKTTDIKDIRNYNARWTDCCDLVCPCRPCWHPHDMRRHYSDPPKMECATRYRNGCPNPLPKPNHIYQKMTKTGKIRNYKRCVRCGMGVRDE